MGETLVEIDSTMLLINQFTANLSDWELLKKKFIYIYIYTYIKATSLAGGEIQKFAESFCSDSPK